jgi:hypothetical protein
MIHVVKYGMKMMRKLTFTTRRLWITKPVIVATVSPRNTSTKTLNTCNTIARSSDA